MGDNIMTEPADGSFRMKNERTSRLLESKNARYCVDSTYFPTREKQALSVLRNYGGYGTNKFTSDVTQVTTVSRIHQFDLLGEV